MRIRLAAALPVLVLVSAACGNSEEATAPPTPRQRGPTQTTNPDDYSKHVAVTAKGVTDTTITVDTITSKTNPLHGKYAEIADGIQAYFDMVNADGGIYGRKLQIGKQRDDLSGLTNRSE